MGYWLICTLSLSHPLRPPRCLPQPRQIRLDFPCLTEVHQIKGAVTNSIISSTCTRIEPPVAGVAITIDRTRVRGPVWRGIESERSDCRNRRFVLCKSSWNVCSVFRSRESWSCSYATVTMVQSYEEYESWTRYYTCVIDTPGPAR